MAGLLQRQEIEIWSRIDRKEGKLSQITMLTVKDIQSILQVSQAKAYEIIRSLNVELKEKGFYVLQGKINKDYFEQRFYGKE